jgi:hypothetical protein
MSFHHLELLEVHKKEQSLEAKTVSEQLNTHTQQMLGDKLEQRKELHELNHLEFEGHQ